MRISWRNLFWKLLTFLISEIDAFSLGRYMSNAIGFPCKLNCVLSSYITYEFHAFCLGNSYLNAIPSLNALTARFTVLSFPFFSTRGTIISLQWFLALLIFPTTSSYVSSIFLLCTFPALSPAPNSPLSNSNPSLESSSNCCFPYFTL